MCVAAVKGVAEEPLERAALFTPERCRCAYGLAAIYGTLTMICGGAAVAFSLLLLYLLRHIGKTHVSK